MTHAWWVVSIFATGLVQETAPQPQNWQVHYTGEGRAYYHNAITGTTQWEAPAGLA